MVSCFIEISEGVEWRIKWKTKWKRKWKLGLHSGSCRSVENREREIEMHVRILSGLP